MVAWVIVDWQAPLSLLFANCSEAICFENTIRGNIDVTMLQPSSCTLSHLQTDNEQHRNSAPTRFTAMWDNDFGDVLEGLKCSYAMRLHLKDVRWKRKLE